MTTPKSWKLACYTAVTPVWSFVYGFNQFYKFPSKRFSRISQSSIHFSAIECLKKMHMEERKVGREFEKHFNFYVDYRCLHCVTNINDLCDLDHLSLFLTDFKVIGMKEIAYKSIIVFLTWKSEPFLDYFEWCLAKQSLSSSLKSAWWIWRLPACRDKSQFYGISSRSFSRLDKSSREILVPFWRPSLPDPRSTFFVEIGDIPVMEKKPSKRVPN